MKIKYLGTAAAEGCPSMFCNCERCKGFRVAGGKNLRARTQALIDGDLLVDFHADTYMNFQRFGLDASAVKHILITHSHEDHWNPMDLWVRNNSVERTEEVVTVYGSKEVLNRFDVVMKGYRDEKVLRLQELKLFERVQIGEYAVTPLKAAHTPTEECFIFLIEKGGKALLYCNDTGLKNDQESFSVKNIEYMQKRGIKLDFIGFDCTYGTVEARKYGGHMSLYDDACLFDQFKESGLVHEGTKVVVTHFSHWNMLLHDDFQRLADEFGFTVAYDGIETEI